MYIYYSHVLRQVAGAPIGVNIAKTHDPSILGPKALEDFERSFQTLAPLADFVAGASISRPLKSSSGPETQWKTMKKPCETGESP